MKKAQQDIYRRPNIEEMIGNMGEEEQYYVKNHHELVNIFF